MRPQAGRAAGYLVDCVSDADSFDEFRRPLDVLARCALEPAPGAGFAWTRAALQHLRNDAVDGRAVLIWKSAPGRPSERLCLVGAFTVTGKKVIPGFSWRRTTSWAHLFSFSGAGLVHRDYASDVFGAYFDWVFGPKVRSAGLLLDQIPAGGPFARAMAKALGDTGLRVRCIDRQERAVLDVPDSVDAYLVNSLPRKKRKELRRLGARLGEQGTVEFHQLADGDDVGGWLEDFYKLEARGWKGRARTALSCDPAWSGFFDTAFAELHERGEALIWKLTLDGRPVAMTLGARNGRQAWLFKIAHDEDFAKYSPGVLMVLEVMKALSRGREIDVIDSCAQADHPMINHLWRERLALHTVLIGRPGQSGAMFELLCRATRFKRDSRQAVKRLYKAYLKGDAK